MSDGARLVVTADLRVRVDVPDGRSTTLRLRDDGGVLRVEVPDLPVLLAGLPRGDRRALAGARARLARLRRQLPGAVPWDQPVDVVVHGRLALRRRSGRWQPAGRVAAGAAAAAVATGAALVAAVLLLRRLGRAPTG